MNPISDKVGTRLVRFCPNLECRCATFLSGDASELHACPGCGAEGLALNELRHKRVGAQHDGE